MASFYGGINAVSLGTAAGSTLQGASAIAIGYKAGAVSQPASSIVINATGSSLSGVAPNALYIAPIRNLITGTLLMYDTLNKEVVYSSTLNTTFTANNIISLGNLSASTVTFSTVALNTASVSTANVQFLNYSTLSGSTITANTQNVSTVNVQFLNYSTLSGSTITSNVQNVSTVNVQFLNYSTLSGSTISVSVQNVLTTNVSTANVQFLNYSSLSGSTISNNVSNVSTANVQFLNYSSLSGSTIRANTQNVSTLNVQFLNYSSLSGSTISNNVSNVSTANVQFINYSSLTGSTITVSVQNVSTVNVQFMNYSSLSGSTITNNVSNVSTANVQFINYSSLSGSTISTNTANITTLTTAVNNLSTIYAQNILFSTLRGSTLTTNTGFITSTLTVSTIIAANISVSSLALDKFSTLTGSSIIASTVAISTITSNTGFFNSTLTVSTLLANTGFFNSTLTTSTLLGTSILASTVAFSTLTLNTGFITSTLTVSTIIAANISVSSLALDKFSTLTGSSIIASTVAISTLASNTGFFNSTLTVSTLIVSTTNTQFMNYSTLIGSTISSNVAYSNLLLFSSIASVNGSSFGNTGPTGNTGATGPTLWAATGTNGPYNNAITYSQGYVGVGPTGTSYLQTTSGGATAGTSSYVPQYPVDVAGTVRSSAQLFADNSAMVSATPSLDYNTFGKNWTIISQLPATGYNACAMSANGQYQVVAAASPNGIYYSSNYGQTWTRSVSLTTVACVSLAMSASGQYAVTNIVGGSNLIYISNNYGQTWTATTQGIVNSTARAAMSANGQYILIASQGATNQLYSSSDYGSTWTRVGASSTWTSVAMSASGQYQLACPLESGKYCNYSFNYGQTWQQSTTGPTSVFAFGMTMSASGQYACLVLSNAFGAYYSSNYGQSWTASSDAINMYNVCMSASGQYAVAVAATGGTNFIYYSINYGINWIKSSYSTASGFWYGCAMSANGQYLLAVNAGATNVVQSITPFPPLYTDQVKTNQVKTHVVTYADNSTAITATPALDYTTFGKNWTIILSINYYKGCAISANGQYQVVTTNGIYYSSDYGQSWTLTQVGTFFYGIAMSASGQYVVACLNMSPYDIYISSNYGQTWTSAGQQLSGVLGCIAISASGQYISAVSDSNQIYISNNNGITWRTISLSNSAICVIMSASGQYQIVGTNIACYYSSDYGQTWQQSTGTPNNGTNIALTISASGGYAIAAIYPIGLYSSSDYGKSWSAISSSPTHIYTLSMSASGQYVIGGEFNNINNTYYIYYSINYGINWMIQTSHSTNYYWKSCVMSSSGQYLLLANANGNVINSITQFPPQMITSQSTSTSTALNITAPNINTGQNVGIVLGKNTSGSLNYGTIGFQYIASTSVYNYLYLGTTNNPTLCITGNNYVGIGTTNPTSALTVSGIITCENINSSSNVSITNGISNLDYSIFGQNWTQFNSSNLPTAVFSSCAMSANGKYQVITKSNNTGIYYSSNYGQTWAQFSTVYRVSNIAMSANGQYALTTINQNGAYLGYVLKSSDFGQTWGYTSSFYPYTINIPKGRAAISNTGQYMTIVGGGGGISSYIFRSADYGNTWNTIGPILYWVSVAMSYNGDIQIATVNKSDGFCYYSSDYGQTWQQSIGIPINSYGNVCCLSSSGQYGYVALNLGGIYISSDFGQTWTASDLGNAWSVSTSASGQYAIAGVSGANPPTYIYYSKNYGQNWTVSLYSMNNPSIYSPWLGIALSSDGKYGLAVSGSSTASVSSITPTLNNPLLSITNTNSNPINSLSILAPNMVNTLTNHGIIIGQAASTYNAFKILYNHIGIGNTSNYMSIGAYNSDTTLNIIANGNVGIGTTIPTAKLHIYSANNCITASWDIARANSNDYVTAGIESYFITRDGYQNLGAFIRLFDVNTNSNYPTTLRGGAISFGTIDGTTAGQGVANPAVERMRILANGNVGIGTTVPASKLSVQLDGTGIFNPASWYTSGYAVFGPNAGDIYGGAVGITYNSSSGYGALLSLAPSNAWKPMYYSASAHYFKQGDVSVDGTVTATTMTASSSINVLGTVHPTINVSKTGSGGNYIAQATSAGAYIADAAENDFIINSRTGNTRICANGTSTTGILITNSGTTITSGLSVSGPITSNNYFYMGGNGSGGVGDYNRYVSGTFLQLQSTSRQYIYATSADNAAYGVNTNNLVIQSWYGIGFADLDGNARAFINTRNGAIHGSSINTSGATISGAISSGAITCTSITTQNNNITVGSGTVSATTVSATTVSATNVNATSNDLTLNANTGVGSITLQSPNTYVFGALWGKIVGSRNVSGGSGDIFTVDNDGGGNGIYLVTIQGPSGSNYIGYKSYNNTTNVYFTPGIGVRVNSLYSTTYYTTINGWFYYSAILLNKLA